MPELTSHKEVEALAKWLDGLGKQYDDMSDALEAAAMLRTLAAERDAAQGEVERLRAGGCARDQRTTQYCAEAMALVEERDAAWESGADTMRWEIIRRIRDSLNNCDSRYDGGMIAGYESAIDSASDEPIPPQEPKS